MSVIIDGTNGISDVDGSASTPAIRGTDANTGIFFPAADTIAFAEGGSEVMRIDSSGNVGIGTTSPANKLDVISTTASTSVVARVASNATTGANSGTLIIGNGGTGDAMLRFDYEGSNTDRARIGVTTSGQNLQFFTAGNNERMRITSGGYLKASNNGTYINSTGSYHEFSNNSSGAEVLNVKATNASFASEVIIAAADRNTTNNSYYFYRGVVAGVGTRFLVADSGNVTNTNGSYGTISDIKNKENIVDATPKLDKVNQLQVRNFNFKGDDFKQIGFIAQEFEQVFPSMVEEHADKDANGNDLGTTTKSIKTSVLVPILVKAIQELNAKVEAQAAEIAALKNPPQPVTE